MLRKRNIGTLPALVTRSGVLVGSPRGRRVLVHDRVTARVFGDFAIAATRACAGRVRQ
jgi:hypothetical protein